MPGNGGGGARGGYVSVFALLGREEMSEYGR